MSKSLRYWKKFAPPRALLRLEKGLSSWRHRFADRIFAFTEAAPLAYDDIIAPRRSITAADGMIAAVRRIDGGRLATRNPADFATTDLELIRRWDF